MIRETTHKNIVKVHEDIATAHKRINGFYRFDFSELAGNFRAGVGTPALLLESHSNDLNENANKTITTAQRAISFLIIDFAGKADDYDKKEEVLDDTENIALDVISYFKKQYKEQLPFFRNLDLSRVSIDKVGPLFDQMYGWNVTYILNDKEPMCFDPEEWTF